MIDKILTSYSEVVEGLRRNNSPYADPVTLKFYWLLIDLRNNGIDVDTFIDRMKESNIE